MLRAALLLTPLLLLAFAACGGDSAPPLATVPARWNTSSASDPLTLARSTGTVFAGTVTAKAGQREEDGFPVSTFSVRVDEAISGAIAAGDVLSVEQPGGLAEDHDGRTVQVALEGDEPIIVGIRYLFFATLRMDGVYTTSPFSRFRVEGDGSTLRAAEAWAGLGVAQAVEDADTADVSRMLQDAAP